MSRSRRRFTSFLEQTADSPTTVAAAAGILEPLCRYDREHNADLIQTLQTYFACGRNVSRAAETLFLHRNGLQYRLSRIEEILAISLGDRDVAMALELAIRISEMRTDER